MLWQVTYCQQCTPVGRLADGEEDPINYGYCRGLEQQRAVLVQESLLFSGGDDGPAAMHPKLVA
jgi:hypothetical protein